MTNDVEAPGIDRSMTIRAPVDEVWQAVSTADGLEAWLGGEVELDPRPGRPVSVRWPDGSTSRGLVERVDPGIRIVFRWRRIVGAGLSLQVHEPTRVEILLTPTDDRATRVEVTESPAPFPAEPVLLAGSSRDPSAGRGVA